MVVTKTTAAARRPNILAAGQALSSKSSKALEGLLPKAFGKTATAASRKQAKAVQEGDDNAAEVFSVPPSVKAVLTRCAAQSRERVASGSAAAEGGGRGNRSAQPAASTESGGRRQSPATPSLTPFATEHSTISASSEHGDDCRFFTAASANGGKGNGRSAVGNGRGGCDDLASGRDGSGTGGGKGDAGIAVCDVHATEAIESGSGEGVDDRRSSGHAPEGPTGDEHLLGRPSGGHEPMGSGDGDQLLTNALAAERGDENGSVFDERRDSPCVGSGDVPCVSAPGDQDVGSDCCAKCPPGSAGAIAAAVNTDIDRNGKGDGDDQRKLWKLSTEAAVTPTVGVSLRDLEAALPGTETASTTNGSSRVLVGLSDKSKAISKAVASPFRRRKQSTTP